MEENESEIQVRALTGELTIVSVSPCATISHLKNLLKLRFPPAFSVDFHLFFKGVKLSAQSKVPELSLDCGEFLVLIPFVKKDARQKDIAGTDIPCNEDRQGEVSSFADSVYSDMMQEFSTLNENSSSASPVCDSEPCSMPSGYKRRKVIVSDNEGDGGGSYGFLWSVLTAPRKNIMEGKNCEEFVEVLESLSCLKNPYSGKCMLFDDRETVACGDSSEVLCLCPEWLKQIMGAFVFLNIFSAFLQLRRKNITCACLKEALKELQRFGFRAGFEDVEHLPVLCPKVVSFENSYTRISSSDGSLVIINCETEESDETENHPKNEGKSSSFSMIFSAVKKRESTFQTHLWKAAKRLLHKSGDTNMMLFSLEDLIKFVKGGGLSATKTSPPSAPSSYSIRTQCHESNQLLPMEMIQHLKEGIGSKGQMVHIEDINARKATYVEIPHELSNNTKAALKYMGISKLYSHQAESILASLAGKSVVVATMTSSGKSLCYNVPVLEVLSQNLSSCALYLFPTKALAQDQLRALLAMGKGFHSSINIGVYDGDTTQKDRTLLRSNARLLITNPDMLHMSILPYHRQFSRILSNLRFVVIDEAHAYKGAFGCHTALILRRLRRLCSHVYGSDPSFVFSTATSANPREHCMELANLSTLELIKNDGSPSSQKLFVLWNPSCLRTVPHESGIGKSHSTLSKSADKSLSPISEVSHLFAEMVQHGLRCIAFCKSRKLTELVLSYTREILQKTAPHLADLICAYRAGYTAEDRRKLEQEFFCGKLCGIAATNALELGIDVGAIDATLHLGFPGSISSLWQQAGRSGRRERQSLAVYVAFEGPLDQYFMKFPRKLFGGPIECCHIDAQNQQVLQQHLVCAALEHPVSSVYDEKYFGSTLNNALMSLRNRRELSYDPSHDPSARIWSYIGREKAPSRGISIRAIEAVRYRVIDMKRSEVLEEIEESKAFFQVYEGAVYMHQGKTYLVKELDVSEKIASCHEAVLHYYTKTRDYTDIHVVGGDIAYPERSSKNKCSKTTAQANSCKVTTTWFGYRCIQRGSNKVLDTFDLSLPEYSYDSQAVWVRVPPSIKKSVEERFFSFRGGLHAASHALINVVPLFVRCNSSDLAPECPNPHDARSFVERILLYDQHPGGTGVSMQIQPYFTELLNAALELLTSCQCSGDTGCPNCVQSVACQEYNELIHKDAAIMIIKGVLDAESSYFAEVHNSSQKPKNVSPDIHIAGTGTS